MNAALPGRMTVLIAALGGQGGGVLAEWIARAARARGFVVQATSTPGVSQRTGATTYYLELVEPSPSYAASLVLGLAPLAGEVDVLVCAELLEAARMLERGMCTPGRTAVVASTHRAYTTIEKMSGGDGRYDAQRIVEAVRALSRRATLLDLEDVRSRHCAAISAALFGAVAGSGALPLLREDCEAAIRDSGKGVAASVAAFEEAFARAADGGDGSREADARLPMDRFASIFESRLAALPPAVAGVAREGVAQVAAYQDAAYAATYLDRLESIVRAEASVTGGSGAACETARFLALWMCYDDIIRVASHKGRAARLARIRREVRAADADIVRVFDFFKPGAAELADILPRRLGLLLARGRLPRSGGKGFALQSSSVSGALALRAVAGLRALRPRSLRFAREQCAIEDWLGAIESALRARDAALARELARLPRLRKGYAETHAAGEAAFRRALDAARDAGTPGEAAARVRDIVRAALH